MMDVLFEQRIIQNTGIATEATYTAVAEYFKRNGKVDGLLFPLVFLVLPMAFHKRTAIALSNKTAPGAIYKALVENRELTIGLQNRMESFYDKTLQALSIANSTNLLKIDYLNDHRIIPVKTTALPILHVTEEVKTIISSAKRIGQMFHELSIVQIATTLEIEF